MSNTVLVVEDEASLRIVLSEYLKGRGFQIVEAADCASGRKAFFQTSPAACVIDFQLPDGTALDLIGDFRRADPFVPLIVLTAFGTIEMAVNAVKAGADHFLTKPVEFSTLAIIIERAIGARRDRQRMLAGRSSNQRRRVNPFMGTSPAIRRLEEQVRRIVDVDTPVLIQGETGTGKTLLARWIHENSSRADEAFVDFNCAGLTRDLLETELFGHEKGAFTGATASKQGLFEVAHRGSVFLDEIGDVDPVIQPKLLKVLEEKQFRRLGDVRDKKVDIRLIAASHQELTSLVREKKFRSDLYFRISTIPLRMPALRERTEDIPMLARELLISAVAETNRSGITLSDDALEAMQRHTWPGNIRELKNVIERAVLLSGSKELIRRDLLFDVPEDFRPWSKTRIVTLSEMEREYVEWMLQLCHGKVAEAAKRLDIPKSTLYQRIKEYGPGVRVVDESPIH